MINLQTHALFHQYVYSDLAPGRLFRVKTGSGMGQCASGELSDWYLYSIIERWSTDQDIMQRYRVMIYCRYRDDILIVYEDERGFQEYLDEMKQTAKGVWTLKLEGQSDGNMYYLDITIFKGEVSKKRMGFSFDLVS